MQIDNITNENAQLKKQKGIFGVIEHSTDLSQYSAMQAISQYYMQRQNIHKRQLVIKLENQEVVLQNGIMQWISGHIQSDANVKGVGDFIGKMVKGAVTKEATVNPIYRGSGMIICEPTYKHILLEDIEAHGGLVVRDGVYLASEGSVSREVSMVKSVSGAIFGGVGLFNTVLRGTGIVALESPIPEEELIKVTMSQGEEIRVDGPFALMWDDEIIMTVERSGKTLIGSAAGGEGLVNVFRGVGSVWLTTAAASVKYGLAESTANVKTGGSGNKGGSAATGIMSTVIGAINN